MIHEQAYTTSYLLKLAVGCYRLFVKPISRIDVEKLGKITHTHTQILVHRPIYHLPYRPTHKILQRPIWRNTTNTKAHINTSISTMGAILG